MNRRLKAIIAFLLVLAGWVIIAPFLAERLIVEKKLERADVILVLSGSAVYIERAAKAADIYRRGIAAKIILTNDGEKAGWSPKEERNPAFSELSSRELIAHGVPPEAIEILPGEVSGTFDEAELFQKKASENGWNSVLLVTSAYHTRRTLQTFENEFSRNQSKVELGIESAEVGQQTPRPSWWWLTPGGWNSVGGEYLKSSYYWLFY
jgi:uncharacterized SAM-binding protein YcdF (DUF218 family)